MKMLLKIPIGNNYKRDERDYMFHADMPLHAGDSYTLTPIHTLKELDQLHKFNGYTSSLFDFPNDWNFYDWYYIEWDNKSLTERLLKKYKEYIQWNVLI